MRLAAHIGYSFSSVAPEIQGFDVLGTRWRVLNAAVGVAFAFAEAIARTPTNLGTWVPQSNQREHGQGFTSESGRGLSGEDTMVDEIE